MDKQQTLMWYIGETQRLEKENAALKQGSNPLIYCKEHRTLTSVRPSDMPKWCCENAALKRLLTSMTCGECDETMPDCTCPDTKSLLTKETNDG